MLARSLPVATATLNMKTVRKAVVTAAAPSQHDLPLQQLVDQDGQVKTALQLVLEQSAEAGIEEFCLVIRSQDHDAYRDASAGFDVTFAFQEQPLGYADAMLKAKSFVGDEPFLHSVGDHVYLSAGNESCVSQLISIAAKRSCSISAVQATRENTLPYFGIVAGPHLSIEESIYEIQTVVEKPTPTRAEQDLVTPGLRSGYYLGFFGLHVLEPEIMTLLQEVTDANKDRAATLSDALAILPSRGKYLAAALDGTRYNLGVKYGLLKAQLAIALSGNDRDEILSELVDLMATRAIGVSS